MEENNNFESFLEDLLNKDESSDTERLTEATTTAGEVLEKKPVTKQRNPFKFLDAYTPADQDIFFGRDMEIKELYHSVFSHKVSVIFGSSGGPIGGQWPEPLRMACYRYDAGGRGGDP